MRPAAGALLLLAALLAPAAGSELLPGQTPPPGWLAEWPDTDFTATRVPFHEVLSGGPPKDGIPAIDRPRFLPVAAARDILDPSEPVLTLIHGSATRAYPLRYLIWHEIVNDVIDGERIAVTYCPLCNTAIAFRSRSGDLELDFGVTGKLRHSDLVMYDRQTESWWQQFDGRAIIGEQARAGAVLEPIPVVVESWGAFLSRDRAGMEVLVLDGDEGRRPYGTNPYVGYDSLDRPWLYSGDLERLAEIGVRPLDRVVRVGERAWPLERVLEHGVIRESGLTLTWTRVWHSSALDHAEIRQGRAIPSIHVTDHTGAPVVHQVTFAFVFHAFVPGGVWHFDETGVTLPVVDEDSG